MATAVPPLPSGATLVGRAMVPGAGPSVVRVDGDRLTDVTSSFPTVRDLCETADPAAALRAAGGADLGPVAEVTANAAIATRDRSRPWLLSPVDLQAIKAAGVTFVVSMLERVIEERARGDADAAATIRGHIRELVGDDLRRLKPGSPEAAALKETLIRAGAWSQYLEVGIGPDAEIFTKGQPTSSVGTMMDIGVHPASTWNNPEPEAVMVLGKAKDNNAAAAIGPFVRLFDAGFDLDAVRRMEIGLTVEGTDGFVLRGHSSIAAISRDPADLVAQAVNAHHPYPDGLVLYLGTMFAPIEDRDVPGRGFTHRTGDVVTISSPELGALVNRVVPTDEAEPWTMGAAALMRNLAGRGLLG
jgi:fumarylacetoacetate (FAA) hydrolase family protein